MIRYLNPILWLRSFLQFFNAWFMSIPWRETPKAIPAIVLMSLLTVASAIAWSDTSNWRTDWLNKQLTVALEQEDYEIAELVIMRQLRKRPNDTSLLFRLARVREATGDTDGATELMRSLSRIKEHEQASRWLLSNLYIGKDWATLDDDQKNEFGELLKSIHGKAPKDTAVMQMYADYLIATQRFPQAIPLLEQLASFQPMRGLQAAALSRQLGNMAIADRLAEKALDAVSRMSEEDPTNAVIALAVAQNQLFLNRHGEAIQTLTRSIKRAKSDKEALQLKHAYGDTMVAWVANIQKSKSITVKDRLRILNMLQLALAQAPNNPRVLTLVADQVLATVDHEDEQVAALRESLINGSSTGISHFIRGTAALMHGDSETATRALKLAAKLMPHSGAILNNLAVSLADRDDDNLEEALKISESAIKQTINPTAHFFETRGQILFRLGRYLDAIPDLERALTVDTLAPKAHETLAKCYEEVGDKGLSKLHREAAEKK